MDAERMNILSRLRRVSETLERRITWFERADSVNDSNIHEKEIEAYQSSKDECDEIIRKLEAGEPMRFCSECKHYSSDEFELSNECGALNLCYYKTIYHLCCDRWEAKHD